MAKRLEERLFWHAELVLWWLQTLCGGAVSLPAVAELHSRPHRMALLPGTRPLRAGEAPVALLAHSSRPQRQAAPRAALRSHALRPGCAAGTLCGLTLPKVSCPCVHKQRSELPASRTSRGL